jgi:16S rRNA C1402 (ribose-2'-O) methylase RsmI
LGTLTELSGLIGLEATVGIARELTKVHEELVVQPISTLLKRFENPVGEFTVLVPPRDPSRESRAVPDAAVLELELGDLTNRLKRREALKVLASATESGERAVSSSATLDLDRSIGDLLPSPTGHGEITPGGGWPTSTRKPLKKD